MRDKVFEAFLESQYAAGMGLAEDSDILDLEPVDGSPAGGAGPPRAYVATFDCVSIFRQGGGEIVESRVPVQVGIRFPGDYLRRFNPLGVASLLWPLNLWHSNVAFGVPVICPGQMSPGCPLVDVIFQIWEILSYKKANMRENDSLNPAACAWARANQHRFPVDPRPLRRGLLRPRVEILGPGPHDGKEDS